ncbi:acyl-CoA dehydrogenase family protein [Rhodococcus qingshengii]|uniref:acyl-CoA dehydrogenase family protein n=1 Tax=Rhodococcus qingshengii TaxID=334542 RepID=UPI0002B7C39E|nr:acyl-CoA dehydrogenase family protein [Rhodococcus qingshengii]EME15822.1 acyl-CoA dehydrogenase domain-containing protein [Rhodococcus qingshengii BKS 20-40]
MDFEFDAKTIDLKELASAFMDEFIFPAEHFFHDNPEAGDRQWERPAVMAELKEHAKARGLWNLFLPHDPRGAGLSNLQYAPLAEVTGWSPEVAPEAFNCNPPDTGNMELLTLFGTEAQKHRWLDPLLNGDIRSAYCMTEPDVSSSDPANLTCSITDEGDCWRINGRKWWSTGAMSSDCALLIVMGVSDPDADPRSRHSLVLIPRETPGVRIVRGLKMFGFTHGAHGGHAEVHFEDVLVPKDHMLGERGRGQALAQARLGPGRIHHCMRMIGMAERAIELMCRRANEREAFGRSLADQGIIQHWIAQSRVKIDQLRLFVLRTAWLIDTVGAREARTEISAIKVAAPDAVGWVIDKAIQVHGAGGMTQDYPLAMLWAQARTMRFIDGADEVHRMVVASRELRLHR